MGDKIEGQAKEMKRLKVMLEELQTKMKELVSRCRAKFGAEVKDIAEDLGLKDALKENTVFERLYDDAIDRVQRLEKLREKVKAERKTLYHDGEASPRAAAAALSKLIETAPQEPQGSVLEAVENSPLTGLQSLVKHDDSRPIPGPQRKTTHLLPPLVKSNIDFQTSSTSTSTEAGTSCLNTPRSRASSRTVSPVPSLAQIDLGTLPTNISGSRRRPDLPRVIYA